jgi:hypothetical protein
VGSAGECRAERLPPAECLAQDRARTTLGVECLQSGSAGGVPTGVPAAGRSTRLPSASTG